MSFPRRMGPALALATLISFTHVASSHADDITSGSSAPAAELTISAPATIDANWYTGGTLHKATAREWLQGSTQNQLATASDWVLTSKDQKAKVDAAAGNMSLVLPSADKLRQCINAALRRHSDLYSSMPASDIAMTCMITLKI
ncbi:MAG: hypothetical protein QM778_29470 [Myxococcales bacterium]